MVSPSTWTLMFNGGAWPRSLPWAPAAAAMLASSRAMSSERPRTAAAAGMGDDAASAQAAVAAVLPLARRSPRPRSSVDRGWRELPIRADYVGMSVTTTLDESVKVRLEEVDGVEEVELRDIKE